MPTPLPLALRIVALISLLSGISSLIHVIYAALNANLFLDFGVLGILAYFGIHRLSSGWRLYLLICNWLALILCPVILVAGLNGASWSLNLFGIPITPANPVLCIFWLLVVLAYLLWQLGILNRPDIVQLFREKAAADYGLSQ